MENFVLHNNQDHSFSFKGDTVYAKAIYEGTTGMARNYPVGNILYLVKGGLTLKNTDKIDFSSKPAIFHQDGSTETIDENNVIYIGLHHDYYNDSMKNEEQTIYYCKRNKELREQGLEAWDKVVLIETEIISLF